VGEKVKVFADNFTNVSDVGVNVTVIEGQFSGSI